jgi:Acyl-CoA dehydrogenase, C-terminal domain
MLGHGCDPLRRRSGSSWSHYWRRGNGLHLSNAAGSLSNRDLGKYFYVTLLKTYLVAVRSFLFVLQRINNISFYQFQIERLAAAALNIIPLETCIQDTIEYTKTRTVFGKPLINNQVSLYWFMFCVHLWISKLLYKT